MAISTANGFEQRGQKEKARVLISDLWRSRELMRILARKEFLARYRRASLGLIWVAGLPIVQATVIGFLFSSGLRFVTGVEHFAVVVLSGMVVWSYFGATVGSATTVIVEGSDMASKIYFPRIILPIVVAWAGFRGFVVAAAVVIAAALIFGAPVGLGLLLMPAAMVLMVLLTAGFSFMFAAMYVYFRDMRFIVQAVMQPWFFASGVIFPLRKLGNLREWFELNPAVGMIEFFRASVGVASPGWGRSVVISAVWAVVLIAAALPVYQRHDRVFVDRL